MSAKLLLNSEISIPEAILRVLEEAGVDMVFGIPGGQTGSIFNALYHHQSTIRTVLVRQETLAGIMAEVYGRLTGKPWDKGLSWFTMPCWVRLRPTVGVHRC